MAETNDPIDPMSEAEAWPFDQPRNGAVITTTHIVSGAQPITYVFHDGDDHGWQFLPPVEVTEEDAVMVALEQIATLDPTVLELANLLPGWMAERSFQEEEWSIKPIPSD